MENTVSSTELARRLGDVLARVRYRHESFIVERNGTPVARVVPMEPGATVTLDGALAAWFSGAGADSALADDLERIGAADRPADNPWGS